MFPWLVNRPGSVEWESYVRGRRVVFVWGEGGSRPSLEPNGTRNMVETSACAEIDGVVASFFVWHYCYYYNFFFSTMLYQQLQLHLTVAHSCSRLRRQRILRPFCICCSAVKNWNRIVFTMNQNSLYFHTVIKVSYISLRLDDCNSVSFAMEQGWLREGFCNYPPGVVFWSGVVAAFKKQYW